MSDFPIHYRYMDGIEEEGMVIIEQKFYPIRETDCFYFVLPEWQYKAFRNGCMPRYSKEAKKVSKNGLRRACYPSKELAMESYIARKKRQMRYAQDALERSKFALSKLTSESKFDDLPSSAYYANSRLIGRPDFIDKYVFE